MKQILNKKMLINSIGYYIIKQGPSYPKDIYNALKFHVRKGIRISEGSITKLLKEKMPKFEEVEGKWVYLG